MERLQTIKQSEEGGWAREEEKQKDGIEGSGRRTVERQGREEISERDRVRQKGLGMEIESRGGLLNVDLWALHFPGLWPATVREGIPSVLAYGSCRISETELNTPRGHRGTEEITSEFVKRPQIRRLNYLHASLPTPSNRRTTPAFVRKLSSFSQSANVDSLVHKVGFITIKPDQYTLANECIISMCSN